MFYIINLVVTGFQMQFLSILRFSSSIFVKLCVHLRTNSSKNSNTSFTEEYIPQVLPVLLKIHRVYFAFCLLSVIRKQWLGQCNYPDVQSALMTGFRTDFTSSVWNFCRWVADVPPCETSLIGDERGETSAVRRLTITVIALRKCWSK